MPGDDVTLCGVTAADAGSAETDRPSVVRQRSDGVEHAVASHRDICTTNRFVSSSSSNHNTYSAASASKNSFKLKVLLLGHSVISSHY